MKTECTFVVEEFTPVDWSPEIETALGVGHAHMVKRLSGGLAGRSITQFSYCYDQETGVGTYVATESFEGTVDGHGGTLNLVHSATTLGATTLGATTLGATTLGAGERLHELFVIVPGSGTGGLAGITGTGALVVDEDGTHRITLDYELDA